MTGTDENEPPREAVAARREPIFNIPAIVLVAVGLCVAVHLVRAFLLSREMDFDLIVHTAFIPLRYSGQFPVDPYFFTTPITYSLLHGGFMHLAVNMVWLVAVGTPLANRIGAGRFILFWIVTAIAAAAAHYAVHPPGDPLADSPLMGASGAISGMMAASARYFFRVDRSQRHPPFAGRLAPLGYALRSRQVLLFIAVWMGGNILVGVLGAPGVSDAIAWEAHIGGFFAGFLLIGLFDRAPPQEPVMEP